MSDNGASRIHIPGQPHRSVADLSARDRSQLMDETLMTVHELLLQVAGMGQAILALKREQDAHAAVCTERWNDTGVTHARIGKRHQEFVGRTFLARLRWLLTGR